MPSKKNIAFIVRISGGRKWDKNGGEAILTVGKPGRLQKQQHFAPLRAA